MSQPSAASPQALSPRPHWLRVVDECASSNDWALQRLAELASGTMVWAIRQTAGRGQRGRTWLSPPGVLTCSLVVECPLAYLAPLPLVAGLAVVHTVEDVLGSGSHAAQPMIKWPNDVYVADGKLAGILCEARHQGGPAALAADADADDQAGPRCKVVIGIGLNVAPQWDDCAERHQQLSVPAISLRDLGVRSQPVENFLHPLRRYLLQALWMIESGRWERLWSQFMQRDWLFHRQVRVDDGERSICGRAAGIDPNGHLVLNLPDGGDVTLNSGQITVIDDQHHRR